MRGGARDLGPPPLHPDGRRRRADQAWDLIDHCRGQACTFAALLSAALLAFLVQFPDRWPGFPRPCVVERRGGPDCAAAGERRRDPEHCAFWGAGAMFRRVSRQSCVGDMDSENGDEYDRNCHFQNVCFNKSAKSVVFFHGKGRPARRGRDIHRGDVYELGPKAVHLRNLPPTQISDGGTQFFLPVEYRAGEIPAAAAWSEVSYHVVYQPFWNENFGHALFDDVLPVVRLLDRFDAVACSGRRLKVWLNTPCDYLYRSQQPDFADRACRFVDLGLRAISDEPPGVLGRGELGGEGLYCVENLFAGSNRLGMMYNPGGHFTRFVKQLLAVSGSDRVLPTGQHIVFVHKEGGGRGGGPHNFLEVAELSRTRFGGVARVSVVRPPNMTFKEQFDMARSATVVVTPCGGISFFAAFMSPSTTRVIIDYWDFVHNRSTKNDPNIWQWDPQVRTLHYRIDRADVVAGTADHMGGKGTPFLLRFERLASLLEDGMGWAELGYQHHGWAGR